MTDTRDDFEAHFKPTIRQQKRHTDGSYRDPLTQARWEGWQAISASLPHPSEVEMGQRGLDAMKAVFADQNKQDTLRIDYLEQWRQEWNKAVPHRQFESFGFELWEPMRTQLDRMRLQERTAFGDDDADE